MRIAILLAVTISACGDSRDRDPLRPDPSNPLDPPPSALPTVALSDSPLDGELVLTPPEGEVEWAFSVDLDDDGIFNDGSGVVAGEQRIPYHFTEVGLHPIRVRFERARFRIDVEQMVAVNDPNAFIIEQRRTFHPDSARPEGIAVTGNNEFLFVGGGFFRVVFRLSTEDLSTGRNVSLRGLDTNTLEGLDLSPSEDRLFVFNKRGTITVLSVPELQLLNHSPKISSSDFFIEAVDERTVAVSGRGNALTLVDVDSGTIVARREIPQTWDIELSPDRDRIVVVTRDFGPTSQIQLLDASTLAPFWISSLPRQAALTSVAFHPSGERIYAFGLDNLAYWLFVVDSADGTLLREIRIESRGDNQVSGVANPTATTHDRRFVIFPTDLGAYFVDTELDIPRYRFTGRVVGSPPPTLVDVGCCNVATPEGTNAIYFVNFGEIFKVRLMN